MFGCAYCGLGILRPVEDTNMLYCTQCGAFHDLEGNYIPLEDIE